MIEKKQELKAAGLKVTLPRVRILQILEQSEQRHLAAEEIYRLMLDSDTDIGLATIYRVLTQFEAAGLVERHNFDGGQAVFELNRGDHHDHMVCIETGKVIEFHHEKIEELQTQVAEQFGYELHTHSLVLYVKPKTVVAAAS